MVATLLKQTSTLLELMPFTSNLINKVLFHRKDLTPHDNVKTHAQNNLWKTFPNYIGVLNLNHPIV